MKLKQYIKNKIIPHFSYLLNNATNGAIIKSFYDQKYSIIAKRLDENKGLYLKYVQDEPMLFTFCMPTYNGQKYLARALESILMQETSYKYKIWVIDDCSTDNTVKILREYEKKYPDIFEIWINEKNEGGRTMAPKIYNNVKTKYWMNFDQDDYWLSVDKLQRTIDYFELHPDCTLVSSNLFIKASNKLNLAYTGEKENYTITFNEYPYPIGTLMQTSATAFRNVFTKDDLEHINSYVGTDKDFCVLGDTFRNVFALSKGFGYYENSVDSVYNWTGTGVWSKLNSAQQLFYNLQYFYHSIGFFDKPEQKKYLKFVSKSYLSPLKKECKMLSEKEYKEFCEIKKELERG